MDTVTIVGRTERGKELVNKYGSVWELVGINEEASIGLFYMCRPITEDPTAIRHHTRWIATDNDSTFHITT